MKKEVSETLVESSTKLFERDERGLVKGITYQYTEDGLIDWFKMLKPEHLYVLKDNEDKVKDRYGKSSKELDLTTIEPKLTCILLSGIRYLAMLRGFHSVKQKVDNVVYDPNYQITASCTNTCTIEWIGNFETGMQPVLYADSAGASMLNLDSFVQKYAETIAANRAYCRAVRGFLNISVVSKDEVGPNVEVKDLKTKETTATGVNPSEILEKQLADKKWSFDLFKRAILVNHKDKIKNSDPETWKSIKDIPKNDIFTILSIINSQ